ncbi:MAG: ATP-grasp domain-containing protein [Candidatus Sericytochromatia bacterium]
MGRERVMRNDSRILIQIVQEICTEAEISLQFLARHWVLHLQKAKRVHAIYGYNLGINQASAYLIANDKFATAQVLALAQIPCVEHISFLRPELAADLFDHSGNWSEMLRYFHSHQQNLVCKANISSGGQHVYHVQNPLELEHAVHTLFRVGRSLCLSPYVPIAEEYRILFYRQTTPLIYRKERPFVYGNGTRSVLELMREKYAAWVPGTDPDQLLHVPEAGEKVLLHWKHNLGQGARAEQIPPGATWDALSHLARQAAEALQLDFAAIDVIETPTGLQVLEINPGIMMESFARQGDSEYALAKAIYRRAIRDVFELD